MTPTYEKDGKWYCYGIGNVEDVGPFTTEQDARLCHEAMNAILLEEAKSL